MINVEERKGVRVHVPLSVGPLGKVLTPIAEARVTLEALNSVCVNDESCLTVVTDNNRKAMDCWEKAGFRCEEVELICCDLPNKTSEFANVANRLDQAGIDVYATFSCRSGENQSVYFQTNNNSEAVRRIRS